LVFDEGTESADIATNENILETTAQIPEVEYGGKYGYMRANTDICPEGK
jgi:hypothetical protein